MASTASETLNPGMPVYDIAGSQVGMIRAVRGGYFDLDAGEPGYWLSVRYITCEDGRGVLTLPMRELAEHRVETTLEEQGRVAKDRVLGRQPPGGGVEAGACPRR